METIQQIVERIPRAFELAAEAMGLEEADLRKLIESGRIDSATFLNAVSVGLELRGEQNPGPES